MVVFVIGTRSFQPLQVMCEVNGFKIPAMIDTGAEISIMSSSCAKRCNIWSDVDSRMSGKVVGVGTSDIIGGINALSIKIGPVNIANKISILKNSRYEFLIGMDILRRFDTEISMKTRTLRLQIREKQIDVPLINNNHKGGDDMPIFNNAAAVTKTYDPDNTVASMKTRHQVRTEIDEEDADDDRCDEYICNISMEGI
jgi:hypothetical protein